jgi:hypothetical protein
MSKAVKATDTLRMLAAATRLFGSTNLHAAPSFTGLGDLSGDEFGSFGFSDAWDVCANGSVVMGRGSSSDDDRTSAQAVDAGTARNGLAGRRIAVPGWFPAVTLRGKGQLDRGLGRARPTVDDAAHRR